MPLRTLLQELASRYRLDMSFTAPLRYGGLPRSILPVMQAMQATQEHLSTDSLDVGIRTYIQLPYTAVGQIAGDRHNDILLDLRVLREALAAHSLHIVRRAGGGSSGSAAESHPEQLATPEHAEAALDPSAPMGEAADAACQLAFQPRPARCSENMLGSAPASQPPLPKPVVKSEACRVQRAGFRPRPEPLRRQPQRTCAQGTFRCVHTHHA